MLMLLAAGIPPLQLIAAPSLVHKSAAAALAVAGLLLLVLLPPVKLCRNALQLGIEGLPVFISVQANAPVATGAAAGRGLAGHGREQLGVVIWRVA